jgi:hypothetical protein
VEQMVDQLWTSVTHGVILLVSQTFRPEKEGITLTNYFSPPDTNISRVIGSSPNYPVNPDTISAHLAPNSQVTLPVEIFFSPTTTLNFDLMYLVDVSQTTFALDIKPMLQSQDLYDRLRLPYGMMRFGISTFTDKPLGLLGSAKLGDYEYQTNGPLDIDPTVWQQVR